MGRFLNADEPILLGANGGIMGYNMFAYCSNNPVMYIDPSGFAFVFMADNANSSPIKSETFSSGGGGVAQNTRLKKETQVGVVTINNVVTTITFKEINKRNLEIAIKDSTLHIKTTDTLAFISSATKDVKYTFKGNNSWVITNLGGNVCTLYITICPRKQPVGHYSRGAHYIPSTGSNYGEYVDIIEGTIESTNNYLSKRHERQFINNGGGSGGVSLIRYIADILKGPQQ